MNNNTTPNNGDKDNRGPGNRQSILMFLVLMLAAFLVFGFLQRTFTEATTREISYDEFLTMLEEGEVAKVEDTYNTWRITPKEQPFGENGIELTYYTGKMDDPDLLSLMREQGWRSIRIFRTLLHR